MKITVEGEKKWNPLFSIQWVTLLTGILICLLTEAHGSEPVCAQVQIRILQKLTMERQGFEASLQVTNGLPLTPLTHFNVTLLFTDSTGHLISSGTDSMSTGLTFWYGSQAGSPIATNATIAGGGTQTFKWLIVPTVGAAQSSSEGTTYLIGAHVSYDVNGMPQSMQVEPDYAQVYPTPILDLEYFLPEQVIGQDPNTPNSFLPPVSFSLGVRVINSGIGTARGLKINSGQPQIVSNDTGLAIRFKIVGSEVQGESSISSLLVNFGDLPGGCVALGCWIMEASLTGKFISFTAGFNHTDALGGAATSLIRSIMTYRLLGEVMQPLGIRGFLAYPEGVCSDLYLFLSNSLEKIPVKKVVGAVAKSGNQVTFNLGSALPSGFIYSEVEQSDLKGLEVTSAVRSDGVVLSLKNTWISAKQDIDGSFKWHYYLNLFDSISGGRNLFYNLELSAPAIGNHPPVIQAMPDHYLKIGSGISCYYLVNASDQDGDKITLDCRGLPTGAVFNLLYSGPASGAGAGRVTGLFTWVPTDKDRGDYSIRFTASDGKETTAESMGVHVISGTDLQIAAWRQHYWPGVSDLGIVGDEANPARDGYPNLMKYAFGVDPTKAEGTLTEISKVQVDGTTYLALSYVGRMDDPTLCYSIQACNSLLNNDSWTELNGIQLAADQTQVPTGFQRVTVRDTQSVNDPSVNRRFLRLKINTVNGPSAGYCRLPIAGHGSSVIGIPLLRDAVVAGRVTATGSNQVTVSDAIWGQNQFLSMSQPYYLEIVTGKLAGCFFPITGNTVDSLILDSPDLTAHPLGGLLVDSFSNSIEADNSSPGFGKVSGDLVRIRQAWTLGVLMGSSGSDSLINSAASGNLFAKVETVSIPDDEQIGIHKSPFLILMNKGGLGWVDRHGTDYTNLALWPGTALIVHRFGNRVGSEWCVVGQVQSMPFVGFIPAIPSLSDSSALSGTEALANDLYFAPVIGESVGIAESGLMESGVFQSSLSDLNRGDEIKSFLPGTTGVYDPEASRLIYFSSVLKRWQEFGVTGTNLLQFEPGKGYLFRIKAGNRGGYWKLIQNN